MGLTISVWQKEKNNMWSRTSQLIEANRQNVKINMRKIMKVYKVKKQSYHINLCRSLVRQHSMKGENMVSQDKIRKQKNERLPSETKEK